MAAPSKSLNYPELEDEEAKAKIDAHSETAVNQIDTAADTGKDKTKQAFREVKDVSGDSLNPQESQSTNIAKTGGSKGTINNRSFNNTLNLMRRVDRYNNKPVGHVLHQGHWRGSGIQDLGTEYERPKIETMESRTMNQAMQLDTQQKQAAIALQDAINHKDIDAFKTAYEQIYGITLSTTAAIQAMRQWSQQQQITNLATKDVTGWNKLFMRAFDLQTLTYLDNLSKTNNPLSQLITNAMYGLPTMQLDERVLIDGRNSLYGMYAADGMNPMAAMNKANNTVNTLMMLNNNAQASATKRTQNIGNQFEGYQQGKDIVSEAKGIK